MHFCGVASLDDQDRYDPKELESPKAASVSDTDQSDAINKMRIESCLNTFDFKKVEALNRILLKDTVLNEAELGNLAKQMLEECLKDDKNTAYAQTPSNLLVTRQDDELILWYAPIYSMGIKIEPKPPKCDGIRKLDLDD